MKRLILLSLLLVPTLTLYDLYACTTFIISGKYTPDGKPILYKHRDTGTLDNSVAWFNDGKYPYLGVVNGNRNWKNEVFGGYNSAGFAIINSVAYNLNAGDTSKYADQEGEIMKMALMSCSTVDEFERMLNNLPKPLGVDANFGVIDAHGGAAYFETGNRGYRKIDVNDPAVAPFGYLIRTNHAFTGSPEMGSGYIRYATAEKVLYEAAAAKRYSPRYLIENISRNLTHSLTGDDLAESIPDNSQKPRYRFFEDFIPRISTASVMMIVGMAKGEKTDGCMMWTILGFPLTSVSVPLWLTNDGSLPRSVRARPDYHAPICDASLFLKESCFPITRGSGKKYIDISRVLNKEGTGYMQQIRKIEDHIFSSTPQDAELSGIKRDVSIKDYYRKLDSLLETMYKELFDLSLFE